MADHDLGCLGSQHLQLFGAIVQWFARYEQLMRDVISSLTGADGTAVMLLTRRLDFGARREALLDLLRYRRVPLDQFDRIHAFLLVPHTHAQLLHDICHAGWAPGKPPGSLQPEWILNLPPTIAPLREVADQGGEASLLRDDGESAYSLDDLRAVVDVLASHHDALAAYLRQIGLLGVPALG